MSDKNLKEEDGLSKFKDSIVLLQGIFEQKTFDILKETDLEHVFVLEGRPNLDAARFSCRALIERKIKPTLIADNMSGFLFYKNLVKEVWLSYHIVDDDGALCQIGALILGVLAKRHKIPVKIYPNYQKMHILGHEKEIFHFDGERIAPDNIKGFVPLVEWVPQKYITEIFREN